MSFASNGCTPAKVHLLKVITQNKITNISFFGRLSRVNPELELLRNQVTGPPDVKPFVEVLISQSQFIHAAFLFTPVGLDLRRELCIMLSGTKSSQLYSGWEDLGYQLNMDSSLVQVTEAN